MRRMDIEIVKGSTFSLVVYWETLPVVYKSITAILQTAPVRMTVPGHGALDGARGAVSNVTGMREMNPVDSNRLTEEDYHRMTVIDADTIEFNEVNAAGFHAYVGGGYLRYYTPVDLTGFSGRLSVRRRLGEAALLACVTGGVSGDTKPEAAGADGGVTWVETDSGTPEQEWLTGHTYVPGDRVDSEELLRLTDLNGRITVDPVAHTIALLVSAEDTAVIDWATGVYDLELVSPDSPPVVTKLLSGKVSALNEATLT